MPYYLSTLFDCPEKTYAAKGAQVTHDSMYTTMVFIPSVFGECKGQDGEEDPYRVSEEIRLLKVHVNLIRRLRVRVRIRVLECHNLCTTQEPAECEFMATFMMTFMMNVEFSACAVCNMGDLYGVT